MSTINFSRISIIAKLVLYVIIITLVFEGIGRKLLPSLSIPIFFLKDLLCLISIIFIIKYKYDRGLNLLIDIWKVLLFLFLPLIIFTSFLDPVLGFFGAKQYLLYFVISVLILLAFSGKDQESFRNFLFFISILVIPTTLVAIIQHSLPSSHWLNTSVDGASLEGFAAGGYLRVSSTFSFTAQFSWFLNAISFFLISSFFLPPKIQFVIKYKVLFYMFLSVFLLIAVFITGGRTAVFGSGATLALGGVVLGWERPKWLLGSGFIAVSILIASMMIIQYLNPEYFTAYNARAAVPSHQNHNTEMAIRIMNGFTEWTEWFWDQEVHSILIGNGIGIMSNGSSQISQYAAMIRMSGFWTEGDVPTTFWEGGIYLAMVWYGFRLIMIVICFKIWMALSSLPLKSAGAFALSYLTIHGIIAQFGIQPPLMIWWWAAIGVLLMLYKFDQNIKFSLNYEKGNSVY